MSNIERNDHNSDGERGIDEGSEFSGHPIKRAIAILRAEQDFAIDAMLGEIEAVRKIAEKAAADVAEVSRAIEHKRRFTTISEFSKRHGLGLSIEEVNLSGIQLSKLLRAEGRHHEINRVLETIPGAKWKYVNEYSIPSLEWWFNVRGEDER